MNDASLVEAEQEEEAASGNVLVADLNMDLLRSMKKRMNLQQLSARCHVFYEQYGLHKVHCLNIVALVLIDQKS